MYLGFAIYFTMAEAFGESSEETKSVFSNIVGI
jgi:hypothetical protein